ncbi:MAG: ribokinase [Spirochaetes bacterium]|nr:ribokinase [Spirochaetota bacterium]
MGKRPRIVVAGSANVDLIMKVERVPAPGETLPQGSFSVAAGGKGANQAVTLARLGGDVHFVGRLGNDHFGAFEEQSLKSAGVSLDMVVKDDTTHTGITIILIDSDGQNAMVPDLGANMMLSESDIDRAAGLIRGSDLLLLQFEVPEAANRRALDIARDASVPVVLNPAPYLPEDLQMLKASWISTPNLVEAEELARLAGAAGTGSEPTDSVSKKKRAHDAGKTLLEAGVENVVITMGDSGSLYASERKTKLFGSYHVTAVDATAAGDCFTAALAYGLVTGNSIEDAVRFASAAAAITVSRRGAQPSLPTKTEVIEFIDKRIGEWGK